MNKENIIKCLVFVESPGKCNTIKKYLNSKSEINYEVIATKGHIRQLPSKIGSISIENEKINFIWEDKIESIKMIKDIIKKNNYNIFYIATDQDREGEGIAFHVYNLLKELEVSGIIKRIVFNQITEKALQESIKNPRDLDYNLIHSFLSRLAIDYLIGFTLSPLSWKMGQHSIGRVQSPALRMIIEKELEIFQFVAKNYYILEGIFENLNCFPTLTYINKDEYNSFEENKNNLLEESDVKKIFNEDIIDNIVNYLHKDNKYIIDSIIEKNLNKAPLLPFTTVSMQQEANSKLNYSVVETMRCAQTLYEEGFITYMRTDSTIINDDFLDNIRKYILDSYGKEYLSDEKIQYTSKIKNAQEAHEAIRPTDIQELGEKIEDEKCKKLYILIWKRTVACQMSKSIYAQKNITILNKTFDIKMTLNGSQLIFPGFLKIYNREEDDTDELLPNLKVKDELILTDIKRNKSTTKQPARYTEGSLIKNLENKGIGRPSTYTWIIEILKKREYVFLDQKNLIGKMKAKILLAFLDNFLKKYIDYDFTSQMEEKLDLIANGKKNWTEIILDFFNILKTDSENVIKINLFDKLKQMNGNLQKWLRNNKCEKCNSSYNLYIKNNLFFICDTCKSTLPLKDEILPEKNKKNFFKYKKNFNNKKNEKK